MHVTPVLDDFGWPWGYHTYGAFTDDGLVFQQQPQLFGSPTFSDSGVDQIGVVFASIKVHNGLQWFINVGY